MELRNFLLTIHVLGVIVWLGCGLYEILLLRELRRLRGNTAAEVAVIRIYGRYAGIVALATLLVAAMGVWMTLAFDWGFFRTLWLGIKQGIMAAVLLGMAVLTPQFIAAGKSINAVRDDGGGLHEALSWIARVERHVIPMRIGALIAVALAIFRPTL